MKVAQKEIFVTTKKRYDFVKITEQVEELVKDAGFKDGIVSVNSLHTTASVMLQENDGTIFQDMVNAFERIFPLTEKYLHLEEDAENATAHLKSSIMGSSVTVPVINGKLELGTYQNILFVELDKARNRKVVVTIIGE